MANGYLKTCLRVRMQFTLLIAVTFSTMFTGCTAVLSPIETIPADRVPPQFLAQPQAFKTNIDPARLRQPSPKNYILEAGDVLGVFVEGALGAFEEAPPVQIPQPGSDLPPAIGYPVPVREDGTLSLPLVQPIPVQGLTVQQAEQMIRRSYREGDQPVLKSGRVIVTLLRKRTYRVFVVRQDNPQSAQNQDRARIGRTGQGVSNRSDFSGRGFVLQMNAYENDVFTALTQTGGLPGVNAKSVVRVLRGDRVQIAQRDREVKEFYRNNSPDQFPYGVVPTLPDETNTINIQTRLSPGEVPNYRPEDIILKDGDIVYVDTRETEVYYTGGLLGGGEFLLPRDFDLDVLGAVSLSGSAVGVNNGGVSGSFGSIRGVPPSELILLRKLPANRQIAIRVDLNKAINDPASRMLIAPGDTLILRYKPQEEIANFALGTFFTFGVRRLFNN